MTWKAINVATSADMRDTSFSSADNGYALDQRGGLFLTANGGASWQPIDPGTTSAPRAVITSGAYVLLAGPKGVRRAKGSGEFSLAAGPAKSASVDQFDRGRLGDLRLRLDDDRAHDQPGRQVDASSPARPAAAARRRRRCGSTTSR